MVSSQRISRHGTTVCLRLTLACALVAGLAAKASAVKLVIMAVNYNTGIAGQKAYDIGVKVTAADVAVGGANPVLFVQNIGFIGAAGQPVQAALGSNNKQTIQEAWNTIDLFSPGGGPSFPTVSAGTSQLYRDTWWYASSTATLTGIIDAEGNSGVVTTTPAADGSGVYAQGPGKWVGSTGYLFSPQATGFTGGGATGVDAGFTGLFGPLGANFWDPSAGTPFSDPAHILGDLLVQNGGILIVPLVQLIATGDVPLLSTPGALGTFLEVGAPIYRIDGGQQGMPFQNGPPYLDFAHDQLFPDPEPSTFVLAGLGAISLAVAARRRRKKSQASGRPAAGS